MRTTYHRPLSDGALVQLEDGGFAWCLPGVIPDGATLEAEVAIRKAALESDRQLLRRIWRLDEELAQRRQPLTDLLMQEVGRHLGEGRAPLPPGESSARRGRARQAGLTIPQNHLT